MVAGKNILDSKNGEKIEIDIKEKKKTIRNHWIFGFKNYFVLLRAENKGVKIYTYIFLISRISM